MAYYLAKERVHNDLPVYAQPPNIGENPHTGPHIPYPILYLYPPILACVISTLPKMSFLAFARIWTILLYTAFVVYAATLGRLATGKFSFHTILLASFILFYFPGTSRAIILGQIDPLLWAFFGLALVIPISRGVLYDGDWDY